MSKLQCALRGFLYSTIKRKSLTLSSTQTRPAEEVSEQKAVLETGLPACMLDRLVSVLRFQSCLHKIDHLITSNP